MKTPGNHLNLFILAVCLGSAGPLAAQSAATNLVTQGRAMLVTNNLAGACITFSNAVRLSPLYLEANALAGATRILALPQQRAGSNFLNRLGFPATGRDLRDWTAELPQDTNENTELPTNFNTLEAISQYTNTVMPAILLSQANLAILNNRSFTLTLSAQETGDEAVTVDYGDIQILRAMLYMGDFLGHTARAHNFSVLINHLKDLSDAQPSQLTIQQVLTDYTNLLSQVNPNDLPASRTAFTNAIARYFDASGFIRTNRTVTNPLFDLPQEKLTSEANFRDGLNKALASLTQPTLINSNSAAEVYAAPYFSGARSLRSLLPQFTGNSYNFNSLPDYTFGGVLINEPAWETETTLRKHLSSAYAGIYTSQPGMSGSSGFALLVSPDQQSILIGGDPDNGAVLFASCNVDKSGNGFCDTNSASTTIEIYGDVNWGYYVDGWANADDFSWNESLYAYEAPTNGYFQVAAGYYTGRCGPTGQIQGILAADGEFYFCLTDSTNLVDGGYGQFTVTRSLGNVSMVNGTNLTGWINLAGATMNGTWSSVNGHTYAWKMQRTIATPTDTQPVITSPPLDQTSLSGGSVTFRVTASGSPPLCYQWSCNGTNLAGATGTSLTLTNLPGSADDNLYAVEVHNVTGSDEAYALLSVVPVGSLQVTILPSSVVSAGAKWQVDGNGVWQASGAKLSNFPADSHTVSFQPIPGWHTPANQTVIVADRAATTVTALYVAVDTNPPSVKITSPNSGITVSSNCVTVSGTASDDVAVKEVRCQVNAGPWTLATGTNNWTNQVTLSFGTNTIRAYAVDTSTNYSKLTNSISINYQPLLTVQTKGLGTVSLNGNSQANSTNSIITVNSTNTITATPGSGYRFTNWTGVAGVLTNGMTYRFIMPSNNLVLTANFVPSPFTNLAGTYAGLFFDPSTDGSITTNNAGSFTATIGNSGTFSASLTRGSASPGFSGQFSLTGAWCTNVITGAPGLSANLQLDMSGKNALSGTISSTSGWTATLYAPLTANNSGAAAVGNYTFILEGDLNPTNYANPTNYPGGYGFGVASLKSNGALTWSATLDDGTAISSQNAQLAKDGSWPLYASLYSGNGLVLGWLMFTNDTRLTNDLEGRVYWTKAPRVTGIALYTNGFSYGITNWVDAHGSIWTNKSPLLNWSNGAVVLQGGYLPWTTTNGVRVRADGSVTDLSQTNQLTMTITPVTGTRLAGTFSGTLTETNGTKRIPITFSGAIHQRLNLGYGFFTSTNLTGSVLLEPMRQP